MPGTMTQKIEPRTGVAFTLSKGDRLSVIDIQGGQVADLLAFNRNDVREVICAGRTFDYLSRIYLTTGDPLYSNRSNILLKIVAGDVGRHDFLLSPCSSEMFRILYGHARPHHGCFGNLANALAPYKIEPDNLPVAFNCFMNVPVDGNTGCFKVEPPLSKAGDQIVFEASTDLIVGLTACSAPLSNGGSFKPICYQIAKAI